MVSTPPKYVIYTPTLFNEWINWAKIYKPPQDRTIRPMGIKIGPQWLRWEFDGLEDFYQYYIDITGKKNG